MYESHFGFTSRPFSATPDAERFFPNESSRKAFDSIVSCVQRATGAALIVGGSGLGKSTLLQAIGKHFQQEYSVAILESASINSRKELLQNILFELGLPFHGMEEGELRLNLMDYLKPSDRCPNGLLLCVDEAHLLSANLLEEMRMITNLVRNGQPRARLVLAGNTSIEERLAEPKMESLSQRISTRAYLDALSDRECRQYISDWLDAVGTTVDELFDDDALAAVFTATHGIPRLVNQVCDHALVLAVADGKTRITQTLINEAWSDIQRLPVDWNVLGTQNEQTNEHVIEFGELKSPDVPALAPATEEQEAPGNEVESAEASGNSTPEAEEEPENQIFVFKGPRDPFAEEFEEEEKVVDSFSQIIGHTPKSPSYPSPTLGEPTANEPPVSVNMNLNLESQSPTPPDIQDASTDPPAESQENTADVEPAHEEPVAEDLSTAGVSTQSEADNTVDQEYQLEPEAEPDAASSLDEYLANTREAITFGVGQGIYAETPATDPTEQPDHDEPVAQDSTDENQEARNLEALEEEISQTVEELQSGVDQGMNTSAESETDSENRDQTSDENSEKPRDDRDMIVVQEEKPSKEAGSEIDTVPMRESDESQTSTQAKREDYKQLFDRLRNG